MKHRFERTSLTGCGIASMNGKRQRMEPVSHACQNSTAEYLRSAGRVSENCAGCHQYRAHGDGKKARRRDSKSNPAICHKIWSVWVHDSAAHHTELMDYEAMYLPKNHFIKEESLSTEDYLALFFPFDKLDVIKRGVESMWNIQNDRVMMALAMTMTDKLWRSI